jgi:hypothetical protein
MGLRQISVPIVTDGMILAWVLPQSSAEVIIICQLGCRTRLGRCLSSVRGFAGRVRRYSQSMSTESIIVASKCQQLKLVVNKVTSVLNAAALPRSVEVSEPSFGGQA